jgi:hypothetical protein
VPLRLERALKREIDVHGVAYTVTFSALGVRLVRKGFRKGVAVSWRRLLALAAGEAGGRAADDTPSDTPSDAPAGAASLERG